MAEGRWLPWKEQKLDIRPFPDYKELAKPLKAPPHGLEWRRFDDGHWELRTIKKRDAEEEDDDNPEEQPNEEEERIPEFLEHVVMPEDTLTGICMRYKVKERELKRLNDFIGDKFRMCDTLIVPNKFAAGQQPTQENTSRQPESQDMKLQRFMKKSKLSTPEAKYYLETNAWNVDRALAEWRAERSWELHHAPQATRASQSRQPGALRRRDTSGSVYPVIAGTSLNSGYTVADDGTIQLGTSNHLQDARVPLLAELAHR